MNQQVERQDRVEFFDKRCTGKKWPYNGEKFHWWVQT